MMYVIVGGGEKPPTEAHRSEEPPEVKTINDNSYY